MTAAYEQLLAEGFIAVRQGARPQVAVVGKAVRSAAVKPAGPVRLSAYGRRIGGLPPLPVRSPDRLIADFRYGDLAPSDFPAAIWRRAVNAAMAHRPDRLAYEDPRGSRRLRTALQGYLWRARTLRCDLDPILIVNGSQQGLDLCARLILDAGDRFVIENPCYAMARQVFASTGALPVPTAADRDGLRADLVEDIDARLAYVTPSHQFPLGGVMPVARRHRLVAWAERRGAWLVEDDYDSEYRYDINPVPPLHGLEDSGRVIYLGTISKTLSPTLRIGYLVVPPALQEAFAAAKQLTDRHSPLTEQEALAALIESGAYERHLRRVRRANGERREALLAALRLHFGDRIAIEGAEAGLHIVAWFAGLPAAQEPALVAAARRAGVGVYPLSPLYDPGNAQGRPDAAGLVMGYAALDARRIARGVEGLAAAVEEARKAG